MTTNKTTVAHCLKEPFDVYIGRRSPKHSESVWRNPYRIGPDGTREEVIVKHWDYLHRRPELLARVEELRGKRLGCYCRLSTEKEPGCHGDNYIRVLEGLPAPVLPPQQIDLF